MVSESNPANSATAQLGPTAAVFSGREAQWDETQRPRRLALPEFRGLSLGRLDVNVLLDNYPGASVEGDIARIEALVSTIEANYQPQVLRLQGPVPRTELRWVLLGVKANDTVIRGDDGERQRQGLDLSFLEYAAVDLTVQTAPAQAAQARAPETSSERTHVVRKGETLWGIAASHLGNGNRWKEIANLNGVRDPRKLKIGTTLRMP